MATNESAEVDAAIDSGAAFAALHEHSGVALAFFSIGGRFLRVNAAFCRLLGYTEEELLQKTHLDVVHVDDMEATAISRAQVISGKSQRAHLRAPLRPQGRQHDLGARGRHRRARCGRRARSAPCSCCTTSPPSSARSVTPSAASGA